MSKINYDQRMEIYRKRKQGATISYLVIEYRIKKHRVEYLLRLLDRHGPKILRNGKN